MIDGIRKEDVFVHDEGSWNVTRIREEAAGNPKDFPVVILGYPPSGTSSCRPYGVLQENATTEDGS